MSNAQADGFHIRFATWHIWSVHGFNPDQWMRPTPQVPHGMNPTLLKEPFWVDPRRCLLMYLMANRIQPGYLVFRLKRILIISVKAIIN
jgi:hypothetical protein